MSGVEVGGVLVCNDCGHFIGHVMIAGLVSWLDGFRVRFQYEADHERRCPALANRRAG